MGSMGKNPKSMGKDAGLSIHMSNTVYEKSQAMASPRDSRLFHGVQVKDFLEEMRKENDPVKDALPIKIDRDLTDPEKLY